MTNEATDSTGTADTNAGESTQTNAADQVVTETGTAQAEAKPEGQGAEAPVAYDFKLPEGVELDTAVADEFKTVAADLKLAPESAQKVVDFYAKLQAQSAERFVKQVETWGEQVRADKEIGGAKLDENLAVARKAVDTFGSDELKSLLNSTGMGNHPEVVKMMVKIGQAISEDKIVRGGPAAQPKDAASILYGSTTQS